MPRHSTRFLTDMPFLSQISKSSRYVHHSLWEASLLLEPIFLDFGFLPEDRNNACPLPPQHKLGRLTKKIKITVIKFLSAVSKNRKQGNKGTA